MPNTFRIEGTPNNNKVAIECMSDLYLRLRERAISSYGYNEEGMYLADVKNMAMDVDGWYGYDTTFRDTKNFDIVKEMVDDNIPLVVGTTGSITYDNHAMSVNGYIKMQKTSGWWIFTSTDTKWILAVDDGHQDSHSWGGENRDGSMTQIKKAEPTSSTPTEIQSSFLSARFQTCPPSNSQPSVSDSI